MPEAAPDGAAPDEPATKKAAEPPEPSNRSQRDREADRLAELAARLDPVPPEVTEAARRAWRARILHRAGRGRPSA